jgi:hypothetical protein
MPRGLRLVSSRRMKKNSTARAKYDGPSINGCPALSIEDVQQWVKDAYDVVPPQSEAAVIAANLNHCLFLEAQWKNTPEFKKMRRNNQSISRIRRIHLALTTLQKDLPVLIDDTLKVFPDARTTRLLGVIALLASVNTLAPGFQTFGQRPGREPELWRRIARNLGPMIITALKSAGVKRAGFGKPTSPAVKIMRAALDYLDVRKSHEAIVDAMRIRKRGEGK